MKIKARNKQNIGIILFSFIMPLSASFVCSTRSPVYWPPNGTVLRNVSWNVTLSDSSAILRQENDIWVLPTPSAEARCETTQTHHASPQELKHPHVFKHSDQIAVHNRGFIHAEYYRFANDGVYLLGYSGSESSSYALFKPPLLFLPNNLENVNETQMHETTPTRYDVEADSEHAEQKMRISLTVRERGFVQYDGKTWSAVWVKMRISQDVVMAYGSNDLLLNDAMMLQSDILLVEDFGPVLEWGVRSQGNEQPENVSAMPLSNSFIRITLHQVF